MPRTDYTNKDLSKAHPQDFNTYIGRDWQTRLLHDIRYTMDQYGLGLMAYLAFPRPIGSIICGVMFVLAGVSTWKEIAHMVKTAPDKDPDSTLN